MPILLVFVFKTILHVDQLILFSSLLPAPINNNNKKHKLQSKSFKEILWIMFLWQADLQILFNFYCYTKNTCSVQECKKTQIKNKRWSENYPYSHHLDRQDSIDIWYSLRYIFTSLGLL